MTDRHNIAAWTPGNENAPPFLSITDVEDRAVEFNVRERPSDGNVYGPTVTVTMSYLEFDEVAKQIDTWRRSHGPVEAVLQILKDHHEWHLRVGEIGLQDGSGGWIAIDNAAEYADSSMCERTEAALAGRPPDEIGVMPRGGINAFWWKTAVLERRQRKKAEAALREARRFMEHIKATHTPQYQIIVDALDGKDAPLVGSGSANAS